MTLYHLILKWAFELEQTPEGWRHGHVTAIHKKGDRNQAVNYRGLNLSSVTRAVVIKACTNRMSIWY